MEKKASDDMLKALMAQEKKMDDEKEKDMIRIMKEYAVKADAAKAKAMKDAATNMEKQLEIARNAGKEEVGKAQEEARLALDKALKEEKENTERRVSEENRKFQQNLSIEAKKFKVENDKLSAL